MDWPSNNQATFALISLILGHILFMLNLQHLASDSDNRDICGKLEYDKIIVIIIITMIILILINTNNNSNSNNNNININDNNNNNVLISYKTSTSHRQQKVLKTYYT